jgi:hypothetical protein
LSIAGADCSTNYADAMCPVRQLFGTRALQSLDEADLDELVRWMLT